MDEKNLHKLLSLVIDHYIGKGEPIGSKFLNSLDDIEYAPSTLRKYLNILEKEGLLYQPYNSSGRVPTVMGMSSYMDALMDLSEQETNNSEVFDVNYARKDLKSVIEMLGKIVDGAAVGFLKEDEYYALGINNLIKDSLIGDHELTKYLIEFVESKEIIQTLDTKLIKKGTVYYTILEHDDKMISIVYTKLDINGYDAMVSIISPSRTDHKRNISILKKLVDSA